ncbi:MAG: hypothetical protein ACR2IF_15235 [Terriglobales bacterium]
MRRIAVITVLCAALAGCGGGGGGSSAPSTSTTTPPATGTGAVNPVNSPAIVGVLGGQTAAGVDITVIAPGATTPPNTQDLGVAALTGTGRAFNTGDIIHRGATNRVLLFGPGLSANMQVSIRGPSDITISDITGTSATDGTPGITFTALVSPSAALGARTVVLQNANGDITTFTGGLEVVP